MESVKFEPADVKRDDRGLVFEPIAADEFAAQNNGHVVITQPGHVRGNHYHNFGREVLIVGGPTRVRWKEHGSVQEREVNPGDFFRMDIPPGIPHAFKNIGDAPSLMVAFNTMRHNPDNPDVVREELF